MNIHAVIIPRYSLSSLSYSELKVKAAVTTSSILLVLLPSSSVVVSSPSSPSSVVDFLSNVIKADTMIKTGMMKNVMLIDMQRNRFRHLVPKHGDYVSIELCVRNSSTLYNYFVSFLLKSSYTYALKSFCAPA